MSFIAYIHNPKAHVVIDTPKAHVVIRQVHETEIYYWHPTPSATEPIVETSYAESFVNIFFPFVAAAHICGLI